MSGMIRLGSLIEKAHIKYRDFAGGRKLEAFGVSNIEGIVRTAHRKSDTLGEYLVIEPGSFAYNPYRVNVGSIGLTPDGVFGVVSPAYVVFRAKKQKLVPEVLLDFLKSSDGLRQINKLARGAVRKALRFDDLCEIEFPAISYERQLEILEHKQGFNLQHGRLLSEIEYQASLLAKLKQAILQEAIQGKLTADWRAANPDVESASQLLKRINAYRLAEYNSALLKASKLGGRKPKKPRGLLSPINYDLPDWPELPPSWVVTVVDKIGLVCVGSTPDRNRKEYWGGTIPWVSSGEVANCHIYNTEEKISEEGFKQASVTMHPPGTVLIAMIGQGKTRGQSAVLKISACTNQNSASVVIDHGLVVPEFLWMVFLERYSESREAAKGGNQPALNGEVIGKIALRLPPLAEQKAIVEKVEALMATCRELEAEIEHSRTHAANLLQAVLREAFSGKPAAQDANDKPAPATAKVIPFPATNLTRISNISPTDLQAGIIAMAYQRHEKVPKFLQHFHHVKAEKIVHLAEAHLGMDLERMPVKAAAGPNDYPHLKKVESRAKKASWFDVRQETNGGAHTYYKKSSFDALLEKTAAALGERAAEVDALINLLLPMDTRQAEIVATLYAAWNNLLLLGRSPGDEDIVYEARENWHTSKLEIERERFFKALEWMRKQGLVPAGRGRYVDTK